MASIVKVSNGYRAFIRSKHASKSATFRTRREACDWAATTEAKLSKEAKAPAASLYTLADALIRYRDNVSPLHKGARWESVRINALLRLTLADKRLDKLTPDMLGNWRDMRLTEVSAGSVIRESGILSAVLEEARREWRWISDNPMRDVRRPSAPKHRETVITPAQVLLILRTIKHAPAKPTRSVTQSVARAFLFAIRTGMRAGEICGLQWDDVHDDYATLHDTKNGDARNVPLSRRAQRLISKQTGFDDVSVFGVGVQTMDAIFRRVRDKSGFKNQFTFHDTRHTAATMLSAKLDVLDLCKMFGWRNTKQALTYYNPAASDIAKKLL